MKEEFLCPDCGCKLIQKEITTTIDDIYYQETEYVCPLCGYIE